MKIIFSYATVTGTAQLVCERLCRAAQLAEHDAQLIHPIGAQQWIDIDPDLLVLVTSNTGIGELPGAFLNFYAELCQSYPRIAGLKYALVNLGDSSFVSFCEAGNKLNAALEDLGAVAVTESLVLDAIMTNDPELDAEQWFTREILKK